MSTHPVTLFTGQWADLTLEEDAGMSRLHGAAEAITFVRSLLWELPETSFDAAFSNQN